MQLELDPVWQERLVVAAAAAATLAVIVGLPLGAALGGVEWITPPQDGRSTLTDLGRRALDELPGAYQVGDAVFVPAASEPAVDLSLRLDPELVNGQLALLGMNGVSSYTTATSRERAPAWTGYLTPQDNVNVDLGPLVIGCARWPGAPDCSLGLFTKELDTYRYFRTGLGSDEFLDPGADMELFASDVVGARLFGGGLDGRDTTEVLVELENGDVLTAVVSHAVSPGDTVWWLDVRDAVASVTAYDDAGEVVAEASVS